MANINSSPHFKADNSYNGFDMSNLHKFTSTTGELLPVYYDILQPGDKVTCSSELKTRTLPLESAAMTSISERVEWFFVPMEQIYSFFGSWYFGINDIKTSLASAGELSSRLPRVSGSDFASWLKSVYEGDVPDKTWQNSLPSDFTQNNVFNSTSIRLLEMLGIPVGYWLELFEESIDAGPVIQDFTPILACAYQKIWSDFYRLTDRQVNTPNIYSLDRFYQTGVVAPSAFDDMFQLRYRPAYRDFFTNLYTHPLFGQSSVDSAPNVNLVDSFTQWLTTTRYATYNPSGTPSTGEPTQLGPYSVSNNQTLVQALSPQAIRTSFAVNKLLEVTRRAGKKYDKQVLAHFGVDVPEGIEGDVIYIGREESNMAIGDVVSTADTSGAGGYGAPLGKTSGKGFNYRGSAE